MSRGRRVRRVVTWAGLALAVAVVAIAGYWALARSGAAPSPAPISVPAASQPALASTAGASAGGGADGCLGGSESATALLTAQQTAPLDPEGAAAFALAFLRWTSRYPVDPNLPGVLPAVTTPGFLPEITARIHGLTDGAATAAKAGEDTAFEVHLAAGSPAQYRAVGGDPGGSVSLNVAFTTSYYSAESGDTAQETKVTTVVVAVAEGHWVIAANEAPVLADPAAPITGAPWVSYTGVC